MGLDACDLCGASRLYYRDTTNHRYRCRECNDVTKSEKKIEPADLFASYEAAVAASEVALTQARTIEPTVTACVIANPEQAQWAGAAGQAIAKTRRELEARRDDAAKPLYKAYKAARDGFTPAIKLLDRLESHLADGLKAYGKAQAEAQAKALAEIAPTAAPAEIQRTIAATSADVDGVSHRQHWVAVGADGKPLPANPLEAAARGLAIPAEYWILDAPKLHALARTLKDAMAVTGVKAVDEKTVVFK